MLLAPGGCGWVKHSPRKQLEIASSLLLNPANGVSCPLLYHSLLGILQLEATTPGPKWSSNSIGGLRMPMFAASDGP